MKAQRTTHLHLQPDAAGSGRSASQDNIENDGRHVLVVHNVGGDVDESADARVIHDQSEAKVRARLEGVQEDVGVQLHSNAVFDSPEANNAAQEWATLEHEYTANQMTKTSPTCR